VQHIRPEFARFAKEYEAKGLEIVAIASNDVKEFPEDGPAGMKEEAAAAGYTFPYLFDEKQQIARAFNAACTPDFFLFDGNRRLVYRGQFDGSRPKSDVPVTGADLRAAADAVLAGKAAPATQRPSMGCNIKWSPGNEPAYYKT
jgi:thiol-disulfide isomerase/thioredoxin